MGRDSSKSLIDLSIVYKAQIVDVDWWCKPY
jgi:hypothetical protein